MAVSGKARPIAVSLAIALVAGYIVQHGDRSLPGTATASAVELENVAPRSIQLASAEIGTPGGAPGAGPLFPAPSAVSLTPAPRLPDATPALHRDAGLPELPGTITRPGAFGLPCGPELSASDAGAGMVALSLSAPCRLRERVEISHAGLRFAVRTGTTGTLKMTVPALSPEGRFTLTFADGRALTAAARLPGLDNLDRVALSWEGRAALSIHALEFGADYGEAGHVWRGAPRSTKAALHARGGFMTALGDPELEHPLLAEVYSFPTGTMRDDGVVRLTVEAEVTPYTCERDIEARAAQRREGEDLRWTDITLAMPACDSIGGFLVLKNVLRDLNIARN